MFRSSVLALALVAAAPTLAWADAGPTIDHTPITTAVPNQSVTIRANIVSNTRFPVANPVVYVRPAETKRFTPFHMELVAGSTELYSATLPATLVTADFDYYVEAFDKDDNGPSRQGDEQHPLHVKVSGGSLAAVASANEPTASAPPPSSSASPAASHADVPPAVAPPPATSPSSSSPPAVATTSTEPKAESPPWLLRPLGYGVVALGGVSLGVSLVTGLMERGEVSQMQTASYSSAVKDRASAETLTTVSEVTTYVGIGVAVVGATLVVLSYFTGSDAPQAALGPSGQPALAFRF